MFSFLSQVIGYFYPPEEPAINSASYQPREVTPTIGTYPSISELQVQSLKDPKIKECVTQVFNDLLKFDQKIENKLTDKKKFSIVFQLSLPWKELEKDLTTIEKENRGKKEILEWVSDWKKQISEVRDIYISITKQQKKRKMLSEELKLALLTDKLCENKMQEQLQGETLRKKEPIRENIKKDKEKLAKILTSIGRQSKNHLENKEIMNVKRCNDFLLNIEKNWRFYTVCFENSRLDMDRLKLAAKVYEKDVDIKKDSSIQAIYPIGVTILQDKNVSKKIQLEKDLYGFRLIECSPIFTQDTKHFKKLFGNSEEQKFMSAMGLGDEDDDEDDDDYQYTPQMLENFKQTDIKFTLTPTRNIVDLSLYHFSVQKVTEAKLL